MMLVLQIGFLFLPSWVGAWLSGGPDSIHDVGELPVMARQQTSAPPCRLNYTTDVWTGCDDVLAQFGISLDQFRLANPGIGAACDGFVPGNTYCVAACKCKRYHCTSVLPSDVYLVSSAAEGTNIYRRTLRCPSKLHCYMRWERMGGLLWQWRLVSIPSKS
jgi:hypothetical protein